MEESSVCERCGGTRWVCEAHHDRPWSGVSERDDACGCAKAGDPCPDCNELAKWKSIDRTVADEGKNMDQSAGAIFVIRVLRKLPITWAFDRHLDQCVMQAIFTEVPLTWRHVFRLSPLADGRTGDLDFADVPPVSPEIH